jgi:hypothetical protein
MERKTRQDFRVPKDREKAEARGRYVYTSRIDGGLVCMKTIFFGVPVAAEVSEIMLKEQVRAVDELP